MSPASGRIRAAPRRHQFIQPARRILRSESRRLVTSKETASLPTKEATNVDADGPQGGAHGRPFRERVDAGNPRSSPQHKARNRLPMGARQVTAQADTREALAHMAARPEAFRLRKEGDVTQVRVDAIRARGA